MSVYSITRVDYETCKFVIYVFCLPIICISGLAGNSFSLYILRIYPARHAFYTYLSALTCIDTLLLACASIRSLLHAFESAKFPWAQMANVYGNFSAGILVGSCLQRMSSSLITVISVERLLVVKYPFKVRQMSVETRPGVIIALLVCFQILLHLPTLAIVEIRKRNSSQYMNVTQYVLQRSDFARENNMFSRVYLFAVAIIGIALPFLIVISTTITIVALVKSKLRQFAGRRSVGRSVETERMTLTLVILAVFFSLLSIPAIIIYVWSAYDRSYDTLYLRLLFTDIEIVLVCLNSASDFIIYCLASEKFRAVFLQQLCSACRRTTSASNSSSAISTVALSNGKNNPTSSNNSCSTCLHQEGPHFQNNAFQPELT